VDLELTDEQTWLAEAVDTLLSRHWVEPGAAWEAGNDAAVRLWAELVEFGALDVGPDGLGATELCLISRALGAHLGRTPFIPHAAIRWARAPSSETLENATSLALAQLDPGDDWDERSSFDPTTPASDATFARAVLADEPLFADDRGVGRLATIGALLAAADAVGAAGRLLDDARRYAGERRQFGHTIGSNQSLRHLLADMYVRQASSWSTVVYAAATLDEGGDEAHRTASIAKAYVSRAAREVAHGALQVFGGIGFTAEHPGHRFLRRIVVRERLFGDAAHHERALGRALADAARDRTPVEVGA
jgi:Acyl-CoA dehydrogenase, C-terminal domain